MITTSNDVDIFAMPALSAPIIREDANTLLLRLTKNQLLELIGELTTNISHYDAITVGIEFESKDFYPQTHFEGVA